MIRESAKYVLRTKITVTGFVLDTSEKQKEEEEDHLET